MRLTYRGKQIRKCTETSNMKLAEKIYHKVLWEIAPGKWFEKLPGEDKIVGEMMERYMKEHSFPNKASSSRDERSLVHLLPYFKGLTATEVTQSIIKTYKPFGKDEGASPTTINRELALLKHAFNLALKEWEWIKENPVTEVKMEKENNKRDTWLTYGEEERLLKECPEWLREIVIFALNTGMRLREILSLIWKEIDLNRKTAFIVESENNEKRPIPFNRTVLELLSSKVKLRSIKTNLAFLVKIMGQLMNQT